VHSDSRIGLLSCEYWKFLFGKLILLKVGIALPQPTASTIVVLDDTIVTVHERPTEACPMEEDDAADTHAASRLQSYIWVKAMHQRMMLYRSPSDVLYFILPVWML